MVEISTNLAVCGIGLAVLAFRRFDSPLITQYSLQTGGKLAYKKFYEYLSKDRTANYHKWA